MSAQYAERLEQAAQALEILTLYPDGMSVAELALALGLDEFDARQSLASYHEGQYLSDSYVPSPLLLADTPPPGTWEDTSRADWFDAHAADGVESAVWVALDRELSARDAFGVLLDVPQIVDLLTCAEHLQSLEPDNEDLRTAIAALRLRWVPELTMTGQAFPPPPGLPLIRRAIVQRHRLRFTYAREWEPGVSTRVVEPYELKQTRLGYELDAGPVRDDGRIRTFLVRNMTDLEPLPETFDRPADVAALVAANRETITVRVVVPKAARPSYDALVEHLEVVGGAADDDEDWELLVRLQQPFEERLALFMFRAGPDAFLVEDIALMNRTEFGRLDGATDRVARALLSHHGLM